jgi:hypothetical protein
MENIVALANLDPRIIERSVVHVASRGQYKDSWLSALGIPNSHIMREESVLAKTLIVPEMGRCGAPYLQQLRWMRATFLKDLKIVPQAQRKTTILIIKRGRKRPVPNFFQVEEVTRRFASSRGMRVLVHDDSGLPPLRDQIQRFANADIIVGPHGAGLLFMTFAPFHACVVEFKMAVREPVCYMRLAYKLGLSYLHYPFSGPDMHNMALDHVLKGLMTCARVVS